MKLLKRIALIILSVPLISLGIFILYYLFDGNAAVGSGGEIVSAL